MQTNPPNIHPDKSTNLTYYSSAKELVDAIFQVNGIYSEPFLKIMIWLRNHTPEEAEEARSAIFYLMLAAFEHSSGYCQQVEAYAESLWQEEGQSQPPDQQAISAAESTAPNLALTA